MPDYPPLLPNNNNPLKPSAWIESDHIEFAYWLPNVSGGLVVSNIPMDTDWGIEANIRYAKDAEENGFVTALAQTRWFASYGADHQHEALAICSSLLQHTTKLELITAVHPGLWNPAVVAKMLASLDVMSGGRTAINIASGWFKGEFTGFGVPWLEHSERYARSEEFIRIMKGMWTTQVFSFYGDFYHISQAPMLPKPLHRVTVFQGGNSVDARKMAGRVSDVLLMNGDTNAGFKKIMGGAIDAAKESGRDPNELKFCVNGFCIVRDTMEEASEALREIILDADIDAVKTFGESVKQAGRSSKEGEGMWTNSTFEDLVQYNDGFKTGLMGTPEMVADRIIDLKKLGIKLILCGFLHYDWEIAEFGKKVIPLVREREEDMKKSKKYSSRRKLSHTAA